MVKRVLAALVLGAAIIALTWWFKDSNENRSADSLQVLRVLTYDSLVGVGGPAAELKKAFELYCQCRVQFIKAQDGGILIEKMRLLLERQGVDVVMGLDQFQLNHARQSAEWLDVATEKIPWDSRLKPAQRAQFIPFDWAPLTFIYREDQVRPAAHAKEFLADPNAAPFVFSDPRTSTPGLHFLWGLNQWWPDCNQQTIRGLKKRIYSQPPSWSSAYGLFQRGQVHMVFSYVTSLAYHWTTEPEKSYRAVVWPEGHPYQIEYMAIPKKCRACDLALNWSKFILSREAQTILMTQNYMLPVRTDVIAGTVFEKLPTLEIFAEPQTELSILRGRWIESWGF